MDQGPLQSNYRLDSHSGKKQVSEDTHLRDLVLYLYLLFEIDKCSYVANNENNWKGKLR